LGVLPDAPLGKRHAAPDSESLKHRFCGQPENPFRREFAGHCVWSAIIAAGRNFLPAGRGKYFHFEEKKSRFYWKNLRKETRLPKSCGPAAQKRAAPSAAP